MSLSPLFSAILPEPYLAVHQLLLQLSSLDHVLFLQDHVTPCIFFAADDYYLVQDNNIQKFQQTAFNHYQKLEQIDLSLDDLTDLQNHHGTTAGFISYDFAAQQQVNATQKSQPQVFLGHFSHALKFTQQGWQFFSKASNAEATYQALLERLNRPTPAVDFTLQQPASARWNKAEYSAAFQQVQDYIRAGDCYQINLTQEFSTKAKGQLLATAEQMWQLTNAPYAGYLKVQGFEVLSCSPELFVEFQSDRKMLTKPIKGTMPRYDDPALDEQSKQTLIHSEKDRAENVMIVDLLRNDLSLFAETGSVKTPKLFNIESFNQVHHMVSEVEAIIRPEISAFQVLLAALPGGSITGAPKIRAMQIIEELEGAPRGAYCGSMGYFNADGTGAWNILIRSIQKYQDDVSLWAGGGITIASDCNAEYQECFDKVSAILDLLNTWYQPK